jgi:uncharacterized protein YeaO (DUF488 family)
MPYRNSTYQYGAARRRGEGLRIGTTRYLPRGVSKSDYASRDYFDVWLPALAPSRELLSWFRDAERPVERFYQKYRKEMRTVDARQIIALLREISTRTPIAVGCFCPDESRCHRAALLELMLSEPQ